MMDMVMQERGAIVDIELQVRPRLVQESQHVWGKALVLDLHPIDVNVKPVEVVRTVL